MWPVAMHLPCSKNTHSISCKCNVTCGLFSFALFMKKFHFTPVSKWVTGSVVFSNWGSLELDYLASKNQNMLAEMLLEFNFLADKSL